jgi:hypothetical protein
MASIPLPKGEARIQCFNGLVPIKDWKVFNKAKGIYVGERIEQPGAVPVRGQQGQDFLKTVYFSRVYNPANEIDRMLCEYEITEATVLGFPFLLIPKEKVLFLYDPPTFILKPAMNTFGPKRPM